LVATSGSSVIEVFVIIVSSELVIVLFFSAATDVTILISEIE
jgi:hypothetical protein